MRWFVGSLFRPRNHAARAIILKSVFEMCPADRQNDQDENPDQSQRLAEIGAPDVNIELPSVGADPTSQGDTVSNLLVDQLNLTPGLLANLKSAGVLTVNQLELELKDEKALMEKVQHCGKGGIRRLRNAVESYQRGVSQGNLTGAVVATAKANAPAQSSRKSKHSRSSKSLAWVVGATFGALFVVLVLALSVLFLVGSRFDQVQVFFLIILFGLAVVVIIYKIVGKSHAVVEGSILGMGIQVGGPLAGFLAVLIVLFNAAPAIAPRTVWIYLSQSPDEAGGPSVTSQEFSVSYRGEQGPQSVFGKNGHALAINVPRDASELEVDRVDCFGFLPSRQAAGDVPPLKYQILSGSVTIEMVKKKPAADPMPNAEQVRGLVIHEGLTEAKILQPGNYHKSQVSLTIVNETDRPICLLAYDCVTAFDSGAGAGQSKLWTECKDTREIQSGKWKSWGNFEQFHKPSGWFAIFVRFEDRHSNRIVQQSIGVYNLFQVREPKIVIEQAENESGLVFRVNKSKSRLTE